MPDSPADTLKGRRTRSYVTRTIIAYSFEELRAMLFNASFSNCLEKDSFISSYTWFMIMPRLHQLIAGVACNFKGWYTGVAMADNGFFAARR